MIASSSIDAVCQSFSWGAALKSAVRPALQEIWQRKYNCLLTETWKAAMLYLQVRFAGCGLYPAVIESGTA